MYRRLIAAVSLISVAACGGGDTQDPTGPTGPSVATIEVSPTQQSFNAIGLTHQFSAVAKSASGTTVGGQQITWSSSNISVTTVSASGLATTAGNGTATITASVGSVSGTASVTVQQEIAEVRFSADSLVLDRWGDTARVSAAAVDAAGTPVAGTSVTLSTSDAEVADIDQTGLITTWLAGDVEITGDVTITGGAALAWAESFPEAAAALQTTSILPVRVAVQRNPMCQVPTEFPVQPPVAPPASWVLEPVNTMWDVLGDDNPHRSAVLDADQDGDQDLILLRTGRIIGDGTPVVEELRVWLNEGDGVFSDGTAAVLGEQEIDWAGASDILFADLNGDGLTDLFYPHTGWEIAPCDGTARFCPGGYNILLFQQPGGELQDVSATMLASYGELSYTHAAASGDVDCDGDVDIVEGNGAAQGIASHLLVNQGQGLFSAEDWRLGSPMYDPPNLWGTSGTIFCDLDRDGDQDLVHATNPWAPGDAQTFIAVNDGFGTFRTLRESISERNVVHLLCDDIDLDGFPDVAGSEEEGVGLLVFVNDGEMGLADVTDAALPAGPVEGMIPMFGLVDLNLDGWPDIVPVMHTREQAILWNSGDGTFTEVLVAPGTGMGGGGVEIIVGDFDGDGRPDLHWDYDTPGHGPGNEITWNR
jgi:hypothetical protein